MVESAMAILWWARTRTTKYPRVLNDTFIKLSNHNTEAIKKNTLVTPVRVSYLSYDHWFKKVCNEEYDMVVDTYLGLGILSIKDVEW